jgi:hypothetical protein
MQILYKAKDGKIFDDEWECENYENALECQELANTLLWWNNNREPIPVSKNADNLYFFYIKSDKAVDFMEEICCANGWSYDELEENGMYYWSEGDECFRNTTQQIDFYEDEINTIRHIQRFMWERGQE